MGNRGQVLIRDTGVWLYTHCGKYRLLEDVQRALRENKNWKDPGRMAALISKEMELDDITNHFMYNYLLIVIDFKYNKVEVVEYPDTNSQKILLQDVSIEEFLEYKEEEE